jgi:betaine lipid synthase
MAVKETELVPPLEIGEPAVELSVDVPSGAAVIDITSPLSAFHYQVKNVSA